jgi:hypothetical protein
LLKLVLNFMKIFPAELELLEVPIADSHTYTFWHTRNANGVDASHVTLKEKTIHA